MSLNSNAPLLNFIFQPFFNKLRKTDPDSFPLDFQLNLHFY